MACLSVAKLDRTYPGDPGEPPGANPVHAFFIFPYLSERDAELTREVALRHAPYQPMRADGLSDLDVRGSRPPSFFLHCKNHYLREMIPEVQF
jgi:hypothetical protein